MSNSQKSKQHTWAQHIATWQASNLSQNAYCRVHKIQANQFCYWKQKLAGKNESIHTGASSAFVPVSVNTPVIPEGLTLHFPSGIQLVGITASNAPIVQQLIESLS